MVVLIVTLGDTVLIIVLGEDTKYLKVDVLVHPAGSGVEV